MKTPRKQAAFGASLVATALLLSGCQALGLGGGDMARASSAPALAAEPVDLGAEQLEAGRAALKAGRTIDAIESFMVAKAFPKQMPAAYNGLAVAYGRIGRTDLSERYFLTAVALAPEEDRFRSNLALFYASNGQPKSGEPAMAMAPLSPIGDPAAAAQPIAAEAPAPKVRSLAAGVTVRGPGTHLQRVSRGEVAIRSSVPGAPAANTAATPRRAVIEVGAARPQAYPIRVTLVDPRPGQAASPKAYPIRIPLSD